MDWTPLTEKDAFLYLQLADFGCGPSPSRRNSTGAPIRIAFADIIKQLRRAIDVAVGPGRMVDMVKHRPELKRKVSREPEPVNNRKSKSKSKT
ncbi:hypothetical protein ColLi_11432 [Colletotrichum liriopes]|uniref:Uncharacterized protein n=1 Tax=Colletotrichum liriopes TaxID=708192 RepID=A0AA37GXA6_9PEZI|nr:hypothetical protein ColLi_11432 [Colletotrichum liriopes]